MNRFLLWLAISLLLTGCADIFVSSPITTQVGASTLAVAHQEFKAGQTTFEQMRTRLGTPANRVETDTGFACRWQEKRTINRVAGASAGSLAAFDDNHVDNRFHSTATYMTNLEAFFTKDGVLTSCRVIDDLH